MRNFSNLTYRQEKDINIIDQKLLTPENGNSWKELTRIKSIVSEFIQFFIFNFHLNFLTYDYQFNFSDKPNLIGFTTISENEYQYYETDKIDFFAHYFLYEQEEDNLADLLHITSQFWHREIPSIHFFLDALKGNNVNSTNFIKLVFTVESFFSKSSSNDFMSLTIPLILSKTISESKKYRKVLKTSFSYRNEIVHGYKIYDFRNSTDKKTEELVTLFFELKNIIIQIFVFFINERLYHSKQDEKINHEMIFNLLPNGVNKIK